MGIASKIAGAAKGAAKGAANGAKKVANGAKNVSKAANAVRDAAQIAKAILLKYLIIAAVIIFIVLGTVSLIIDAISGNKQKSIKVTTAKYEEQIANGTFTGDVELTRKAISLHNIYSSKIGFIASQIKEFYDSIIESCNNMENGSLYKETYQSRYGWINDSLKNGSKLKEELDKLKKEDGSLKDNLSDYEISVLNYYNYTKDGKFINMITPYDNIPIPQHCFNTEKYNFNSVNWVKYTHTEDAKDLESDEFAYDSQQQLIYPTAGNYKLDDFVDLLSPYLLCSDIPMAYMDAAILDSNSTEKVHTVTDDYYNNLLGKGNDFSNFAYQIILHGQSNITMNQYVLANQTVDSYFRDYYVYNCTDEFQIKKTQKYKQEMKVNENGEEYPVWEADGAPIYEYVGGYKDGTQTTDESNRQEHVNTRWEPGTQTEKNSCEEGITRINGQTIEYKLANALAFDVNINNSYDYERYSDDDCNNLENPTALLRDERSDYTEVASGTHLTEADIQAANPQDLLNTYEHNESDWQGPQEQRYQIITCKTTYKYNKGDRFDITRYYADTISAQPTSTSKKLLSLTDMIAYNKNEKNDPSMDTISDSDFKADEKAINFYETFLINQEDKALNTIYFLNSNPKIYRNYISSGQAYSKYVGYDLGDFALYKGNSVLKDRFNNLAKDNDNNLPFVYGASYGFDVNAQAASSLSSNYVGGLNLLKEYIHNWEGTPKANSDGTKYVVFDDGAGYATVGWGVTIKDHGGQLTALGAGDMSIGAEIDKEIVDKIEEEEIQGNLNAVKSATSGLDLTEYQIHALVSRAYNCGVAGALTYKRSQYSNFNEAYNATWDQERDDLFDEQNSNADFNHGLYTGYMSSPTTANGEYMKGLERRRKSEFTLFQCGYYDVLDKWYSPMSGNLENIDLYNADGTVNEEKVLELQTALEQRLGLPEASKDLSQSGINCDGLNFDQAVTGKFYGYAGSHSTDNGVQGMNEKGLTLFQCTWWANSRASEYLYSVNPERWPNGYPTAQGNGGEYYSNNHWFNTGTDPKPNSIGSSTGSTWGHVFYVEAVDYASGYYYVSHAGSGKRWYGISKVKIGEAPFGQHLNPFIYLDEPL